MKLSAIMFPIFAAGCVSADGASDKWDDYVSEHSSCETAADCVVIYTECPLGCYAAVSTSDQAAAEARAKKLVDRYERGGRACACGCLEAGPATCDNGACVVGEAGEPTHCQDEACGASCSTCADGPQECPAVEEYCQPDGTCSSEQPMCE